MDAYFITAPQIPVLLRPALHATVAVLISMSTAVNAEKLCGKEVGRIYSGGCLTSDNISHL